ncbi:uncharacterized protein LOC116209909 [Punica granatum]|uniref:Uncharacterized protein LOC116209909 n=1 Tax=Punica granatum TaxID=22663 RepID=A0A218XVH9_PUNGR|nr:uncharacterized protein LOC116209909 [Punica granatum]OWM88798.1 hypothetical protein CDL15_Pgr020752 [Punica granatum]
MTFSKSRLNSVFWQEGLTGGKYYTALKGLSDKLADYSPIPKCTSAVTTEFVKRREEERMHQFLMGLNMETFGTMHSQILTYDPLPSTGKVYNNVILEESRRWLRRVRINVNMDGAVLVAMGSDRTRKKTCSYCGNAGHERAECYRLMTCSYCEKTGHKRADCYHFNGYPVDWEARRNGSGRKDTAQQSTGRNRGWIKGESSRIGKGQS